MKKIFFSVFTLLIAISSFAQMPTSNLTIFSENGEKFFLVLNAERMNDEAQTNIRIEDLDQAYYNCRIIFENKTFGEVTKNMMPVRDFNNVVQDVTYKIKVDKVKKKGTLKFFSAQPVMPDFIAPSNMAVYHFGNPRIADIAPPVSINVNVDNNNTVRQNTRVGDDNVQFNMGISDRGVGVDVKANTVRGGGRGRSTTIIEDDEFVDNPVYYDNNSGKSGRGRSNPRNNPRNNPPRNNNYNNNNNFGDCAYSSSMNTQDFREALQTIKNTSFDDTKVTTAKEIISSNCLYADQVAQICKLFSFENNKLEFAKFAFDHTIDRNNYFKVNNVFSFDGSKQELSEYIRSMR